MRNRILCSLLFSFLAGNGLGAQPHIAVQQHQAIMHAQMAQQQVAQSQWRRQMAARQRRLLRLTQTLQAQVGEEVPLPKILPRPTKEAWKKQVWQVEHLPCFDGRHLILPCGSPPHMEGRDLQSGKMVWEYPLDKSLGLSPMLMADQLIYATATHLLHALDPATGKPRWQLQLEAPIKGKSGPDSEDAWITLPMLQEKTLLLPVSVRKKDGHIGVVYAINLETGKPIWEVRFAWPIQTMPALVGDHVLLGGNGHVVSLEFNTGKQVWERSLGNEKKIEGGPLLDETYHVVHDGKVHALDLKTGALRWSQPYKGYSIQGEGAWLVHEETRGLFEKLWLVGRDAKSGQQVWELKLGSYGRTPWVQDGKVILSAEKDLLAVDLVTGKILWQVALGQSADLPLTLTEEAVYVVQREKKNRLLRAFKLSDGSQLWDFLVQGGTSDGILLPMKDGFLFPGEGDTVVVLR